MSGSSRLQASIPSRPLGRQIRASSAVLKAALLLPLMVPPFHADTTRAHIKMEQPEPVTTKFLENSRPTQTGVRTWAYLAPGGRAGSKGRATGAQCTLTLFCWLAGGLPARRGCTMEAGGAAFVAPWWLFTARCTPQDAMPTKHAIIRRPVTPPLPPPLPDRRHHIVADNPRPPPPPPNREMECGIPRLSPRGLSYPDEEDHMTDDSDETPHDGVFLDDAEDGMGIGEAAAQENHSNSPYAGGRLRTDVLTKRIVGGSEARFGEFPWQAHIRIAGYQCGGVLVGRAHVATAAHCVHRARLRDITVFLGEHDTQNTGLYSEPLPGEARRVVKKVIHPEFQYRITQPDRFDLALLRLSRPVSFRANIIPICLPTAGQDAIFRGRLGVVAGWGKTDTSYGKTGTNILHKTTVPILRDDECLRWHRSKNIRLQLHSEMFCAGHRDGHSDACLGDSGGPLVVLVGGRWTLAGITSAGFGCAVDHQPGIYHKVAVTADWIAEHVS